MSPRASLALVDLFAESFREWWDDHAPRLGAALAYYTLFSISPLLLILVSVGGIVFGQEAAQGHVLGQIGMLVGEDSARAVESLLETAYLPRTSRIATVIGVLTLVVGATGVVTELKSALNLVWGAAPPASTSWLRWVKDRLVSLTLILALAFLLLVSLTITAALAALSTWIQGQRAETALTLEILNALTAFGLVSVLFAMIYKLLPDTPISWHDVWLGATLTAALFMIGKSLLGLYLGRGAVASYGAASALVTLLVWVYYSAQIFLFGAEFTEVYARRHGSRRAKPGRSRKGAR